MSWQRRYVWMLIFLNIAAVSAQSPEQTSDGRKAYMTYGEPGDSEDTKLDLYLEDKKTEVQAVFKQIAALQACPSGVSSDRLYRLESQVDDKRFLNYHSASGLMLWIVSEMIIDSKLMMYDVPLTQLRWWTKNVPSQARRYVTLRTFMRVNIPTLIIAGYIVSNSGAEQKLSEEKLVIKKYTELRYDEIIDMIKVDIQNLGNIESVLEFLNDFYCID
ncbi:MAG: hypothetical protein KDD48_06730 [Bdellovibrionales bacterium]|nr:hypothetical protein [Bdellovibrionales bacterium]